MASHGPAFFLSISNARTGSTWLQTTLNMLPGVVTQREFKWRPIGYDPQEIHIVLDEHLPSVRDQLAAIHRSLNVAEQIKAVGSKLVFDPHVYISAHSLRTLVAKIGGDVRIFGVVRSYLDIFLSFYSRGVLHARGEGATGVGKEDLALAKAIQTFDAADRRPQRVALTEVTRLARPEFVAMEEAAGTRRMSLPDALDAVVTLYHNDTRLFEAVRAHGGGCGEVLEYESTAQNLRGLLSHLEIDAQDEDVSAVLRQPYLSKLPKLESSLVYPSEPFASFCSLLDRSRRRIWADPRPCSELVSAPENGEIRIRDPEAIDFFEKNFDALRNEDMFELDSEALTWRCRNAIN